MTGIDAKRPIEIINAHARARLACDRVRAVIHGRQPDRIHFCDSPWAEFTQRYLRERGLPAETSIAEHFDFDYTIMQPETGPWPSEAGEVEQESGGYVVARDSYGLVMRRKPGVQSVPQQVDCKIKTPRDLERFPFEDPADPERSAGLGKRLPAVCERFCPVLKLGGPFSRTWRLRGMSQFLLDMAADEAFAKDMALRMTDHLIAVGVATAERLDWPPIMLHIADDFAATEAPMMSPLSYERVLLPNLKKMVDTFHAMGFKVSYESEGNVGPMLGLLDASGVDGLAHMEPRAGLFMEEIRERFGDRFFFKGNVCNTLVLPSGDRKAIAREVLRVLSAATDGRYMRLSAHSIGPDVSSDSYDYFRGLMNRYGRYPMELEGLQREMAQP